MSKPRPIVLDFESFPIKPRPEYPPKPVSFSLQLPEWRAPRFYAWGHVTGGNNCSKDDAQRLLSAVYAEVCTERPLLCHNGKFDMDVAYEHFGLQLPPWHQFEDTMILLFLVDPHARELGLKPAAQRRLGMAPEEQDAVKQWVLAHKKQLEAEYPEILEVGLDKHGKGGGIKPSTAGAFVAYAPGHIVEPYANGDVERTLKLWGPLKAEVVERGMGPAYDRERKILPILLRNEREGIRTDGDALERDLKVFTADQEKCDAWLRKALKAPSLDFNKDKDVGEVLDQRGVVTQWSYTKTGQKSVSKQNLRLSHFNDQKIAAALSHRNKLDTILGTFIEPWIRYSHNGWMHTNWNQVRNAKSAKSDDTGGTRTGRPSSDKPNFLNMPKKVSEDNQLAQYKFPAHIPGLLQLPKVRDYILPDAKGHVLGRRDYNQQELRILAHFEDGLLLRGYLDNPRLDVHQFLMEKIVNDLGLPIERKEAKEMNFGYIYGQGLASLAVKMDRPVDMVQQFRDAQMLAIPGLKALADLIKAKTRAGEPIRTWGGREYYKEESILWQGRMLDFGYKLLNYLIQGSAADVTKESIIRYDDVRRDGRFALTVYDENNISVPEKALKPEMLILRSAMMSIELDVPLISDGEWGLKLGSMTPLVEPAPDLSRWIH
jgi:DNA polymerase I-like protein with 3'-5' exonuclease and polymerase domains